MPSKEENNKETEPVPYQESGRTSNRVASDSFFLVEIEPALRG